MGKYYLHLGARKLRRQSRQLRGSECYMDRKLHGTESYEDPHRLTSVCCRSQKVAIFGRAHSNRPCRKRLSDTCQTTRLENVLLKSPCSSCCIHVESFFFFYLPNTPLWGFYSKQHAPILDNVLFTHTQTCLTSQITRTVEMFFFPLFFFLYSSPFVYFLLTLRPQSAS